MEWYNIQASETSISENIPVQCLKNAVYSKHNFCFFRIFSDGIIFFYFVQYIGGIYTFICFHRYTT